PLRPRPKKGRRRSRRLPPGQAALVVCLARPRPNDVFHATRLPFDPGSSITGCARRCDRRPSWRGFGARGSRDFGKKNKLKRTLLLKRSFRRRHRATFSLRRGLDSVADPSQAAHHLVSTPGTKKGDPLGRPRLACYAAKNLARIPSSEGWTITG